MSGAASLKLTAWLFIAATVIVSFGFDQPLAGFILMGMAAAYMLAGDIVAALRERR